VILEQDADRFADLDDESGREIAADIREVLHAYGLGGDALLVKVAGRQIAGDGELLPDYPNRLTTLSLDVV
jgi:hypothetical protein